VPATRKARRRALWGIIAAVFLVGTAVGSVLPILPLFLRERGSSYGLIGIIVGANLVAQFIGQYPAGRLSDRFGRAPLMIGGLVVAGLAIAAFALPLSIGWLLGLRFIQGLGAAAFRPGSRAAVADLVPEGERGIAYGWLSGADMAGLIVGPALGGILAVFGRATVFEATGIALVLAAAVVAVALGRLGDSVSSEPLGATPISGERLRAGVAAVRGLVMLSMAIGFLYGVYNVVWSLFMKTIGATDWEVGLSFSLFALPLVLTAPIAGWASDHMDRRWLAAGSTASTTMIASIYPLLHSVPAVIGVGVLEATATAFGEPAINAFLMSAVAPDQRGRAAGTVGTAETAAKAVGALLGGGLFGLAVWVPFVLSSVLGLALILGGLPWLRAAGPDRRVRPAFVVAGRG
jgi:DHA1 family multidrug resistance protein-like MFS transporter